MAKWKFVGVYHMLRPEFISQINIRVNLTRDLVTRELYVMWNCKAKNLSTLIADMEAKEIPQNKVPKLLVSLAKMQTDVRSLAMKIGWTIKPTTKSEAARPHSKIMEGERSEGVFRTAVKTIVLPRMDNTSSGTFRIQLTMVKVDGPVGILSSSESWSKTESFNRSKLTLSILGYLAFRHTFAENSNLLQWEVTFSEIVSALFVAVTESSVLTIQFVGFIISLAGAQF